MFRTHTCGELRTSDVGKTITLAGWVQTVRKFGAITFVDLRDRYGITQLYFEEALQTELDQNPLGREYVLQATGAVIERTNKNDNLPTGAIEIKVESFVILNPSAVPTLPYKMIPTVATTCACAFATWTCAAMR